MGKQENNHLFTIRKPMDTHHKSVRLKNQIQLHFIIFIWGFTAVLGALISIDAIPLVWYWMLIASLFLFVYIKFRKISLKITTKIFAKFVVGGIIIASHWITFFLAIKLSNVSVALIMMSTGAFFTSLSFGQKAPY